MPDLRVTLLEKFPFLRNLQPERLDQVVKQARPPVFFRRQRLVTAQLRAWGLSDLVTAGSTLSAHVLAARQNAVRTSWISRCIAFLRRSPAIRTRSAFCLAT